MLSAEWAAYRAQQGARVALGAAGSQTQQAVGASATPAQLDSLDWSLQLTLSSSHLQRVKQPQALFAFNLTHADLVSTSPSPPSRDKNLKSLA